MPYSFLHIAAMRNDVEKAERLINGEAPDDVHVWKSMPLEMQNRNLDPVFVDGKLIMAALRRAFALRYCLFGGHSPVGSGSSRLEWMDPAHGGRNTRALGDVPNARRPRG